jgi:hypothetical protein
LKWLRGWACIATVIGSLRLLVMTLRGEPSSKSRFELCNTGTHRTKKRQADAIGSPILVERRQLPPNP